MGEAERGRVKTGEGGSVERKRGLKVRDKSNHEEIQASHFLRVDSKASGPYHLLFSFFSLDSCILLDIKLNI